MPLTWAQVKRGLDPKSFTLRNAPRLTARSGAWQDYAKARPALSDVVRKLTEIRIYMIGQIGRPV